MGSGRDMINDAHLLDDELIVSWSNGFIDHKIEIRALDALNVVQRTIPAIAGPCHLKISGGLAVIHGRNFAKYIQEMLKSLKLVIND